MTKYELCNMSDMSAECRREEREELVKAYFSIAMVYAARNARKGDRRCTVHAPREIHDMMVEYLRARGYTVVPFGGTYNIPGESMEFRLQPNVCMIEW